MRRGRKSHRDQLVAVKGALDGMAALTGKPRLEFLHLPPEPKKRAPAGSSGEPLERDIQKAIIQFLNYHPAVGFVGRFNSGQAQDTDRNGVTRYTRFNTIPGFPDVHGMLKGGRAFYIEVKRPGQKATALQQSFIDMVLEAGGIAFVANSVDDVKKRIF